MVNYNFADIIQKEAHVCYAGSPEVLCAEVVFNPMQLYINANEVDEALQPDAIYFLYTIRYEL